ncbi:O-antigen translocase [Seonamhaeicola marinus]|uniref:O-antigen translocase n=1 Tax=Seonamhaeicola marinus TaxID=1912246 RepID=UPI0016526D0A|nr:O-antigen translocase [Seonamhaeicola marinus]
MDNKETNHLFLKVFSYNSIVVVGKLITSFVVSKVSAIYLGPSGYAIVGNFKNVLQGLLGITSTGFQSGVVKYVTENKNDKEKLNILISSVLFLTVIISFVVGILIYLFSEQLTVYVLKEPTYIYVFEWLAFFLPLVSLNFITIYIANGLQKIRLYTLIITLSNVVNALGSFFLIYYFNLKGALMASLIVPSLSFLLGFIFKEIREIYSVFYKYYKDISITFIKSISTYLFMAIYSSILISLSYILIRNKIIESINTFNAGLWEAMNKISTFYMMFFSSLFTLYLLPELTNNKTVKGYYQIMKHYFKYILPIMLVLFTGLYIFRVYVIKIVLTNEFEYVKHFFLLQFVGDFIKILAFSIAYQFHAKKMVKFYLISDFILYGTFYIFSTFLINDFNLQGIYYAYILSALLYFLSVVLFVSRNNQKYLVTHVL